MTDRPKFKETQLPLIENFYNTLNDEPLSLEDYQRAQDTFFGTFTFLAFGIYSSITTTISFLTSCSSVTCFKILGRQSCKNVASTVYTIPFSVLTSLAWSMALKHTKIELDLITDSTAYLMLENSIRRDLNNFEQVSESQQPSTGRF